MVFLPISFIEGIGGQLFKDLAVTVTVSLLVSMVSAFALIPMLFSRGVNQQETEAREYKNRVSRGMFQTVPVAIVGFVRRSQIFWERPFRCSSLPWSNWLTSGLNLFYRSYPHIMRAVLRHRWMVLGSAAVWLLSLLFRWDRSV